MLSDIRRSFFPLGWTSFGGPAAHMGYFRTEFVERRGWLKESDYADLVALSQFLPGPGSSKVGMAVGYHRAGLAGMAYSWLLFTLPSALLMGVFGLSLKSLGTLGDSGWLVGLLAAAVGVVLHAIVGMARGLIKGPATALIAVATFAALFFVPQLIPLLIAGLIGAAFLRPAGTLADAPSLRPVPARLGWGCVLAFFGLLGLFAAGAHFVGGWWLTRINAFYQAGALVFGGGHVVLPLLEDRFVGTGWLGQGEFLAGYSVAQAMPGPLFTFATYVGAVDGGIVGSVVGTIFIFLPGALLTLAGLYFWGRWRSNSAMRGAFAGINAGVVGLLSHALWDPIFAHGVTGWASALIAAVAYVALAFVKAPPWAVAAGAAALGLVLL